MKSFLKKYFLSILIIILASILRIHNLGQIPIGFNDDEAAFGYNAYSILTTGKDEWGRRLPFPAFESFGDWKMVGYLYPTVFTQSILGLNEFATRLPSALFGIGSVAATYFLAKKLFDKKVAYTASFLLAISPWHVMASRIAFESSAQILPITLATYFFLIGLQKKRFLLISQIGYILTFYIYRSSWIFVPLFVTSLIYLHKDQLKKLNIKGAKYLITAALLLAPLLPVVLTFKGQSRFIQESFITGSSRIGINNDVSLKQSRCETQMPTMVCKLIHNKYNQFAKVYINNYLGNISGANYFNNASSSGFQSFATRSVFYLFELPILIAGFIFIIKTNNRATKVLIPWILIVPLAASVVGIGNFGRINIIMPAPQIIEAFGLVSILMALKNLKYRIILATLFALIITVSFLEFYSDLTTVEPYVTARSQRYGYKQLFDYLKTQDKNYDHVIISKGIDDSHQYIQYAYFQKIDPAIFQEEAIKNKVENGWVSFDSLGKYKFEYLDPNAQKEIPERSILVTGEKEIIPGQNPAYVINDLKGDRIFNIYK